MQARLIYLKSGGSRVTVVLDQRERWAVRRLLMAEPEAGAMLPSSAMDALVQLVGCDRYGIGEIDNTGCALRLMHVPDEGPLDPQVCDGQVPTGFQHDATKHPDDRDAAYFGLRDLLRLGSNTTCDRVIILHFSRKADYFRQHEIDVLTMLEPTIGRLVRSAATEPAKDVLSASERRVLS